MPQVPHYMAAQYLGSLTASLTVFLVYWDSLVWYEHDRGEYRSVRGDTGVMMSPACGQVSPGHGPDIRHLPGAAPQLARGPHGPVHRHRGVPPLHLRHH